MKKVIFHYLRPYYARMALGFVIKFFGTSRKFKEEN